jgi:regulator of protease activity HflC (stomatin/prohibitin superfamily)
MSGAQIAVLVVVGFILILLFAAIRIVNEWERGVVKRLGRVIGAKGPGLFLVIPFIDQVIKMNLQIVAMAVPPQDTVTRDNVTIRVDAVVYFKVIDPIRANVAVRDYKQAVFQVAQTTLRAILGKVDLDGLLSQREQINDELARVIDDLTEPWGVKVELVEIRDVNLPESMQRAMARQAEAERDRRARVIAADGEFQASQKLSEAAAIMATNPQALQLRFLQTVQEVAAERNSTLVMPVPVELLTFFRNASGDMQVATSPAPAVPQPPPPPPAPPEVDASQSMGLPAPGVQPGATARVADRGDGMPTEG